MSQFDDFVAKWNGQPCEVEDASARDQCMDLAFAWCDAMGIDRATIRHQYAYQVWTQPNDLTVKNFEYIPNTPNGIPPEGALIIFNQNVGVAGHISVGAKQSTKDSLVSFDQNWSGASYCKMVTHVYTSVYGWLIRKQPVSNDPTIITQSDAFIAICTKLNVAANKDLALVEIDKLVAIEDAAPQKDKQLSEANSQIVFLQESMKTLKIDHASLEGQIATQADTIQDQDTQIKTLDNSLIELQKQINAPQLKGWRLWIYKIITGGR
jgi:hypothetical protein